MAPSTTQRLLLGSYLVGCVWLLSAAGSAVAQSDPQAKGPMLHIAQSNEKVEMIVNTSRIVKLDKVIKQINVNAQDVLVPTYLSPNQVQIWAKKPGVTQVNLWDEKGQLYTIDVVVIGDARELAALLESEFPNAKLTVRPLANGVLVSGTVDRPQDVDLIKGLAQEYYPKVITNITVGGVQQVLLHLKVYEVSRTKLRSLGFDFTWASNGGFLASGVSGLLGAATSGVASGLAGGANPTMSFRLVDGGTSFFGMLEALRRDDLIKLMSEPTLVTYSGRPAYFKVGGRIPYPVSQGFGAVQIQWESYGTQVDFVPIVLGNGQIRLEVRPHVSEVDETRSPFQGIPAFKDNVVDTGVEMGAGQTLAIAGLVQRKIEARKRAVPVVGELPYIGAMFSTKKEQINEIETLVLVTPEFVDPMSQEEVPPCLPGMRTTSPSDWDLYLKGFLEVPNPCPPCNGPQCVHPFSGQEGGQPTLPPGATPQAPRPIPQAAGARSGQRPVSATSYTTRGPSSAPRNPASANRYNPSNQPPRPASSGPTATNRGSMPGFLGPVGYDVAE